MAVIAIFRTGTPALRIFSRWVVSALQGVHNTFAKTLDTWGHVVACHSGHPFIVGYAIRKVYLILEGVNGQTVRE